MTTPTAGPSDQVVLDLPGGQKLLLVDVRPGTIIEVASWRGTGRPDGRTQRLMVTVDSGVHEVRAVDIDGPPLEPAVLAVERREPRGGGLIAAGLVVLVLALLALAVAVSGLRATVPIVGLELAPGPAGSALAIIDTRPQPRAVGDVVVVDVPVAGEGGGVNRALAVVEGSDASTVTVTVDGTDYAVPGSEVRGRAVALVPYLGALVRSIPR